VTDRYKTKWTYLDFNIMARSGYATVFLPRFDCLYSTHEIGNPTNSIRIFAIRELTIPFGHMPWIPASRRSNLSISEPWTPTGASQCPPDGVAPTAVPYTKQTNWQN
jgi:hypothetical protein